jgi:pyruvate dehydrogenase E2 component (dihydrolipoamide acetyltransferase)
VSNTIEIKVPDIGDFSDIPVIEVLVAAGDRVEADDSLITLESDKATMEVPSPAAGTIRELRVKLDQTVSEGDVVAVLEVEDAESTVPSAKSEEKPAVGEPEKTEAPPEAGEADIVAITEDKGDQEQSRDSEEFNEGPGDNVPYQPPIVAAPAVDPSGLPYASPAIRRFARELGVDLKRVQGSGNKGRIVREDVAGFIKSAMSKKPEPVTTTGSGLPFSFPELPEFDFSRYGEVEKKTLSRIRKLSAGHLHRNWVSIPHVTQHDEADITDMESFRKANADDAIAQGFKLTPLVFLIKASVAALKKYPEFNASLDRDGETLIIKKFYNIGVAVDTPDGLMVPVLRNCERKGIMELAAELAEISEKAREKKLKPQDIQGGCFSISSLGGIGGTSFTPIINAPEVAILGVSRSRMSPVWDGSEFQPRMMLPLSLSYDHRVIDGAAAARFTRYLASRLEDLRRLTL